MEPMLNEIQRNRLWEDLLLAEARAYYFGDLATRYRRAQQIITWITLILSSGAMVTAVAATGYTWLAPLLAVAASCFTFYSLVARNPKREADAGDLHVRWSRLARSYKRLWEDMYAADALTRLNDLEDSDPDLAKPALGLPWDRERMRRWQEHVERLHSTVA